MTTAAFEQSVTDEIKRRVEIYARADARLGNDIEAVEDAMTAQDNVGPHIAKIPLRSEYRDLLIASELYAEQAARHQGEADRLQTLSQQALDQAENLRIKANL